MNNDTPTNDAGMPLLLTPDDVATMLRTTRKAIYCMVERGQLPGVRKIGRRVLFCSRALVDYLDRKCAPSPKERR
jgi:excisionase family DNA binding protein